MSWFNKSEKKDIKVQRREFWEHEMEKLIAENQLYLINQYNLNVNKLTDWKEKIQLKNELENAIKENGKYGNSIWHKEAVNIVEKKANEFGLKLLQQTFHCHICNKPPQCCNSGRDNDDLYWENWNEPGDLSKCSICGKMCCGDHIFASICQTCARTL